MPDEKKGGYFTQPTHPFAKKVTQLGSSPSLEQLEPFPDDITFTLIHGHF